MKNIQLSFKVLKVHLPIVALCVTIFLLVLFVILFQKGVNIFLVGVIYVPAGIVFVLGSSLLTFLLALLLSTFDLKENSVKLLSILASYPITIGLGFLASKIMR